EDVTNALPEIVEEITDQIPSPAIIDGEVVAIDEEGSPQPFQEILRRFRRKYDIEQMRDEVGVELHAFDCLHKDGTDLLEEPLTKRHQELTELLDHGVANLVLTNQKDEILDRESTALEEGHEGIMLKNPDSTYTPGRRGKNWLKRKPDVETLDLVVTGAEWGEGRRANLLGTFLLAANSGDEFETIGKVATGITDEKLEDLTELLKPHIKQQDGQTVDIEPAIVFEVGYEEIQKSPTYSSGYALRFPRFISVRSDKGPDQADSLDRIESLIEKN
ncbi:MAG: ATP-dependent DNA ligase, partial [Halobacteriaceae archaeon]